MEVLPDMVVDLLNSYNLNCDIVQRNALNTVTSVDTAVCGTLRNVSCAAVSSVLHRLDKYFGKIDSTERCICLTLITDYISCSYNNKYFYTTFNSAVSGKFVDNLFTKLWMEWRKIFGTPCYTEFSKEELESVKRMLRMSCDRFPSHFRHKGLLENIVEMSENYKNRKPETVTTKFMKHLSESKKLNENQPKMESTREITNEECECQIISTNHRKIPAFSNMIRYMIPKENDIGKDTTNNNKIRKLCASENFQNYDNIPEKVAKVDTKISPFLDAKEPPVPKKVNAFDILMRRANLKRKAVS